MLNRIGASIYPERSTKEQLTAYLKLLKEQNVKVIFVSMINYLKTDEKGKADFDNMLSIIAESGFDICCDIDNRLMQHLEITVFNPNLSFFKERKIKAIRLDYQMDGMIEAVLSKNSDNISIYLNASTATTNYIENVISHGANISNLVASHNFFPEEFTGLDFELFKNVSKKIKAMGLKVSAFVTKNPGTNAEGPLYRKCEGISESMPTIEYHRNLSLKLQTNFYASCGFVDEVILSTQYATKQELKEMWEGNTNQMIIKIDFENNISEAEKKICMYDRILIREDIGEYLLRCSYLSYFFREEKIILRKFSNDVIPIGSIVIPNDKYGVYKGELEIVKKEIPNNGLRNVVGKICDEQMYMLNEIGAYSSLKFI